ncbi:hypothetical protein BGZ52_010949 [Haplosporangium bisporale]|nr:hypothetical protein BGZ52_010949 [Haplosporangium bisporale]
MELNLNYAWWSQLGLMDLIWSNRNLALKIQLDEHYSLFDLCKSLQECPKRLNSLELNFYKLSDEICGGILETHAGSERVVSALFKSAWTCAGLETLMLGDIEGARWEEYMDAGILAGGIENHGWKVKQGRPLYRGYCLTLVVAEKVVEQAACIPRITSFKVNRFNVCQKSLIAMQRQNLLHCSQSHIM